MGAIINKWILLLILAITTIAFSKADDKPRNSKTGKIEIFSGKQKNNKSYKDREDTLVYDKHTEDTLIFDDKANEDTLIFADDELSPPGSENFNFDNTKSKSSNTQNVNTNFNISQSYISGELVLKIMEMPNETFEITIISADGKIVFSKKTNLQYTQTENLKPGIYFIYVKNSLHTSFKKVFVN